MWLNYCKRKTCDVIGISFRNDPYESHFFVFRKVVDTIWGTDIGKLTEIEYNLPNCRINYTSIQCLEHDRDT